MSEPGIRYITPTVSDDRVIAFEIVGTVTEDEMQAFIEKLEAIVARGGKALIYEELAGFDGVEFGAILKKLKNMGTLWNGIERVAFVSKSSAARFGVDKITDLITPMDMKSFEPGEREAAFAWLVADSDA
jgi:hypothetical protein